MTFFKGYSFFFALYIQLLWGNLSCSRTIVTEKTGIGTGLEPESETEPDWKEKETGVEP